MRNAAPSENTTSSTREWPCTVIDWGVGEPAFRPAMGEYLSKQLPEPSAIVPLRRSGYSMHAPPLKVAVPPHAPPMSLRILKPRAVGWLNLHGAMVNGGRREAVLLPPLGTPPAFLLSGTLLALLILGISLGC